VFVARAPMATPTGRYLGVVHFQRLLREPPASLLGGIVDSDLDPLAPDTPLPEITRRMATYNLVSLAVVDDLGRLVGAVTVDDVLDHLLPRDWRDRDAAAYLSDGGERVNGGDRGNGNGDDRGNGGERGNGGQRVIGGDRG